MQILQDVATHDPTDPTPATWEDQSLWVRACDIDACHAMRPWIRKVRFHQKQQLQYVTIQINSTHSTIPTPFKKTERNVHHETPAKSPWILTNHSPSIVWSSDLGSK
jgi:hypothetical protein